MGHVRFSSMYGSNGTSYKKLSSKSAIILLCNILVLLHTFAASDSRIIATTSELSSHKGLSIILRFRLPKMFVKKFTSSSEGVEHHSVAPDSLAGSIFHLDSLHEFPAFPAGFSPYSGKLCRPQDLFDRHELCQYKV